MDWWNTPGKEAGTNSVGGWVDWMGPVCTVSGGENLFSLPGFEFRIVQPVIVFTITIGLSGILGEIYAKF